MKSVTLISGATLQIGVANFREAKTLFDSILQKIEGNNWDPTHKVDINFIKNVALSVVSSPDVEKNLWPILERCLYGHHKDKINESLFDNSMEARADFIEICYHVALESVGPFMKNLYGKYKPMLQELGLNLP